MTHSPIRVVAWVAPGTKILYAGTDVKDLGPECPTFKAVLLTEEDYARLIAAQPTT